MVLPATQDSFSSIRSKSKLQPASKQDAASAACRLLKAPGGFDHFSAKLQHLYRLHGIEWPQVTVQYHNLNVKTKALLGTSAGVPTVGNVPVNTIKDLLGIGRKTIDLDILNSLSGVLKPGTMTLLLGSPGCGKSTFMKILSGRLKDKQLQVSGSVQYNGVDLTDFVVERTSAYVDQHDNHLPVLTVGETLEFAHACSGAGMPYFLSKRELKEIHVQSQASMANLLPRGPVDAVLDVDNQEASNSSCGASDTSDDVKDAEEMHAAHQDFTSAEGVFDNELSLSYNELNRLLSLHGSTFKMELILRLLGLGHARNTMLGSALVRGVSGGERKRVTTGEMLVGSQRVLMLDEISTGLDSATLYSIMSYLKQSVAALKFTALVSLLQPPPEVLGLFDDIIIMTQGHIIYHGPISDVQQHFEGLGFGLPVTLDLPTWLVELTTAAGQWSYATNHLKQEWLDHNSKQGGGKQGLLAANELLQPPVDPVTGKPPMLLPAEKLSIAFWDGSHHGRAMLEEVGVSKQQSPVGSSRSLVQERFALPLFAALALALKRQWILFRRNRTSITCRVIQVILLGFIIGGLFYQTPASRETVRVVLGAKFITFLFLTFLSMPEQGRMMVHRSVWHKHRSNLFMQPSAETAAIALMRAATSSVECLVFSTIVYWMVGSVPTAGSFFTYLLIVFSLNLAISSLQRFIGAIAPTPAHAQGFGSLSMLILILTSGFAIVRPSIPHYWIWAYYISPCAYALRAFMVLEMRGPKWSAPAPGNPHGLTLGQEGLQLFGFFTDRLWVWVGIVYLLCFTGVINVLIFLTLKYYKGPQNRASVPDAKDILKRRLSAEQRKHLQQATSIFINSSEGTHQSQLDLLTKDPSEKLVDASNIGIQPPQPITLVIQNLSYFVPSKAAAAKGGVVAGAVGFFRKLAGTPAAHPIGPQGTVAAEIQLLRDVTAFAEPGLLAVMGGSGAGKTTLLDVLAGRKTVGRIAGDILVNGRPKQQTKWARQIGFVEQMDIHSAGTTVTEALWFSGRLRLPPHVTDDQVRTRVEAVLDQVDLVERAHDIVGVAGSSGLPSEARKRLTIAVELMANPAVMFLDEPTSGLDARAAGIVMRAISALGLGGRTVVVTIHQPSIQIFEAFDTLLLLQRGGCVTYFGPLGQHSRALIDYMEAVPGTAKLVPGTNPPNWMLDVIGGAAETLNPANTSVDWTEAYLTSILCQRNLAKAAQLVQEGMKQDPDANAPSMTTDSKRQDNKARIYAQPFSRQLLECTRRLTLSYWRMPSYNLIRLWMTLACALIYCSMYRGAGEQGLVYPVSVGNIQNAIGLLFQATNFLGNINLHSGMPVFRAEHVVFYRELAALMYDPLATGLATILAELPYIMTQATVFVPLLYWVAGMKATAEAFVFYFIVTTCNQLMYTAYALLITAATPTGEIGMLISGTLNQLFIVMNGFTIAYSAIPNGLKWLNRIVPTTWVIKSLASSQYGANEQLLVSPGLPDRTTVASYLQLVYGYSHEFRWYGLMIILAYVVGFLTTAVLLMKHVTFLRR